MEGAPKRLTDGDSERLLNATREALVSLLKVLRHFIKYHLII